MGCDFAELVQQNVQRSKDAESIGKRLGPVMYLGISWWVGREDR